MVPRTLHKGLLVEPLLQRVMEQRGGRLPGFVLIVGDEESDDKMIEVGVQCTVSLFTDFAL